MNATWNSDQMRSNHIKVHHDIDNALVETIVGKLGFQRVWSGEAFAQAEVLGEGRKSGKWARAQLGFHKWIHQPNYTGFCSPFYRVLFATFFPFTFSPYASYSTFLEYSYANFVLPGAIPAFLFRAASISWALTGGPWEAHLRPRVPASCKASLCR
jgi:hypothetical protein